MPFTIKTTFNFAGLKQGWSETWYWSSADGNLFTAETVTTPLAQARSKLLAKDYMLTVVRNAVVVDDGGNKVKRQTDLFEPNLPGVASWASGPPNLTLMCTAQTFNNRLSKKIYLRGVPAGLGDNGSAPDLGFGVFLTNFGKWRDLLINFPFGWLHSSPTQTAVISNYVLNTQSGQVTFTLSDPGLNWPVGPGFETRAYIKLPGKTPLDGFHPVVVSTATSCFSANPIGVRPFIIGQLGTMQLYTPVLTTLAAGVPQGPQGQIHPQRMVTHKTGKPPYASRGRSPAKTHW